MVASPTKNTVDQREKLVAQLSKHPNKQRGFLARRASRCPSKNGVTEEKKDVLAYGQASRDGTRPKEGSRLGHFRQHATTKTCSERKGVAARAKVADLQPNPIKGTRMCSAFPVLRAGCRRVQWLENKKKENVSPGACSSQNHTTRPCGLCGTSCLHDEEET